MKKASLIYQVIVGIAIVVLFVLHFSSKSTSDVSNPLSLITDSTAVIGNGSLTVYVNGDSLLEKYDYFKKAKKDFEIKSTRTENEIKSRQSTLEREFAAYQQTAAGMTAEQRAKTEETLMRKEQSLREFSEDAAIKFQEEQNKFNEQLFDKVADFLKVYCKDKNYKIVLNYTKGTTILYADESLDITEEVLTGLNEEYNK
ncbi:MAG: OmpH family outer membrane protein [bacterium]